MQEVPLKRLVALVVCAWLLIPAAVSADSFIDGSVLKKGFKGPEVRLLQQALKTAGFFDAVETTENFGDVTEKAVMAFQASQGITADGIAGKGTITKLTEKGFAPVLEGKAYKQGNAYNDLPALQAALHSEGLFKAQYSTNFGEATLASVKAFQTKHGLTVDGVAGKSTLAKLRDLGYICDPMQQEMKPEGEPEPLSKSVEVVSRSAGGRNGIPIDWYAIKPQFKAGKTTLTIEDYKTGVQFKVQVSYAATVHADIETLTKQDSETVKRLWGGYSWDRRPVLVHFNGEVYAASMNGLPHAGLDSEPEGITVNGRSAGYGKGYNFDDIKGNGIDGHFCLHFAGSRTHGSNQIDDKHQANIRIAAGK